MKHLTARSYGIPRLVVAFCLAVTLVALAIRYPQSLADANRSARENASLDYLDLQLGAGSSVLPDQSIALEARGWIPPDGTYQVAVGERQEGWTELTTQGIVASFMRYFLLPRRQSDGAPWIVCLACDRSAFPGARPVWEDTEQSLAVLRKEP